MLAACSSDLAGETDGTDGAGGADPGAPSDAGLSGDAASQYGASDAAADAAVPFPALLWSRQFSNSTNVRFGALAMSPTGDVLVAANPLNTADLGGQQILGPSFLAEYSSSNVLTWYESLSGLESPVVAMGAEEEKIVAGYNLYWPSTGACVVASHSAFLARYDAQGACVFVKTFVAAGQGEIQPLVVAATPGGGTVLAGKYFSATNDFGTGPLGGGGACAFMAAFDATGNTTLAKGFCTSGAYAYVTGAAADSEGGVALAGYFAGSIDFGGGPLVSAGGDDLFVARLDAAGQHVFSRSFGSESDERGPAQVGVDDTGAVTLAVDVKTPIDLGGGLLAVTGKSSAIARLGPAGNHLWSRSVENASHVASVAAGLDRVLLTGQLGGSADFGCGLLVDDATTHLFVAAFDPSRACLFSGAFGGGDVDYAEQVVFAPGKGFAVGGEFYGAIDFGTGPLGSPAAVDVFVARFAQ